MSGLREKQKAVRHSRILEAAASLFREHGYDAVKMEAIAASAEVSIGTIYNYYRNKGDLLVAIVAMEVNEVLASGEDVIARRPADAAEAVIRLMANYVEHSLVYLSKEMWRHAMAISTQQPESPFGQTYSALDVALAQQTCQMVEALQADGRIRKDVDATALGELIFNNTNMMFVVFIKSPEMTVIELIDRIRLQTEPVIRAVGCP
jgi:AcrR family transcriptional regulator